MKKRRKFFTEFKAKTALNALIVEPSAKMPGQLLRLLVMSEWVKFAYGIVLTCTLFAVLYVISQWNYLLFHSVVECSSIVVGGAIFFFAWNVQHLAKNNYLLWLGPAFLFVAVIDFLHMLAYKGMGVFLHQDVNLPTQLWIAARYLQSLSLLVIPLFHKRLSHPVLVVAIYLIVTFLLITSIFTGLFPDCYLEGVGLTTFKRGSEYAISVILLGAILSTYRLVHIFDRKILYLLMAAIGLTIFSELSFTLYIDVYGFFNMTGHLLKIVAFYLIYRAILRTGLVKPFDLLFHKLKKSETTLQLEKEQLSQALASIRTLKGLLPICSSCKKIRNDKGYWNQVDHYLQEYSDVEFTHSVCPDCLDKLYPYLHVSGH